MDSYMPCTAMAHSTKLLIERVQNDLARNRGNNNIERVNILFNDVAEMFKFRVILGLRALER